MIIFKPKGYKLPKSDSLTKQLRLDQAKEKGVFGTALKIDAQRRKQGRLTEW